MDPGKIDTLVLSAGAAKAGTSWLFNALDSRHDIHLTPIKEIHYFSVGQTHWDVLSISERLSRFYEHTNWLVHSDYAYRLRRDLDWFSSYLSGPVDNDWFLSLFPERDKYKLCGEFSNLSVMMNEDSWDNIRHVSDNVKIIYTLRNPLDRYWSHLKFHFSIFHQEVNLDDISSEEYKEILAGPDFHAHGRYSDFISKARQHTVASEFEIFYFEEFRASPRAGLKGVENFLGLAPSYYDDVDLLCPINIGPKANRPKAFCDACRPLIERELDTLDVLGIKFPDLYRCCLEDSAL